MCEHEFVGTGYSLWPKEGLCICKHCQKTPRELKLEETLSEVLVCFRDEDVVVTDEMKERWLKVLEGKDGQNSL